MRVEIRKVIPPMESAIASWFDGADLVDAYGIQLRERPVMHAKRHRAGARSARDG